MPVFSVGADDPCLTVRACRFTSPDGTPGEIVHVAGEADADTAPVLGAALLHAVEGCAFVQCDLSRIVFFGAAGANAVALAARRAAVLEHRLELCGVRGITRDVVRVAGLDLIMRVSG
ncbi:STAS domain-containing protein [Actinoplanes sp. GCM10030250]|uniref:STAS domain-containing protein n=1 Tax=Actinoplanes sp. GCM10030250 TaxID=3273376 RepID=UPI00361DB207